MKRYCVDLNVTCCSLYAFPFTLVTAPSGGKLLPKRNQNWK